MEKLRNGKWAIDVATPEEVEAWRAEARAMVKKYGWEDRTATPYSHAERVTDLIEYGGDISNCTLSSQQYVIQMLNGLVRLFNVWENIELNGVEIVLKGCNGNTVKVDAKSAEALVKEGLAEYVGR